METQPTQLALTTQPDQIQTSELTHITRGYATYADYTTARLSPTIPEQKQIPGTEKSPQYYWQIPLIYNFGTTTDKSMGDFLIEGCEMRSDMGISVKENNNKTEYSILVKFDMNDPKQALFVDVLDQISAATVYVLGQYKGVVKMPHFNPNIPAATGLKPIVYRSLDENGQAIQGRRPSMYFKLFQRGKAPYNEQTLFTNVDGTPVPWEALKYAEISFRPLIHIKRIYIGSGKASVQMEIKSAVLTAPPAPRGTTSLQTATMEEYNSSRPELADMIKSQVSKITQDRQDQMKESVPTMPQMPSNQAESAGPTFPVNNRAQSGYQQPPQQPSMSDFVAAPQQRFPNPGIPQINMGQPGIPQIPQMNMGAPAPLNFS